MFSLQIFCEGEKSVEPKEPMIPPSADENDVNTGLPYGKHPSAQAPVGSGFVPAPEHFHGGQMSGGYYPPNQVAPPYGQQGAPYRQPDPAGNAVPVSPYAQPQYTQASYNQPYNQPYNYPYATPGTLPPPKKNRTGLIVAIVILVLLLCSCCLVMTVTLGLIVDSGSMEEIGRYDVSMSIPGRFLI